MAKHDSSNSLRRSLGWKMLLAMLVLTLINTTGYLLADRAWAERALAPLTDCPITPDDPIFYEVWQSHQDELGCPISQADTVLTVEQPFLGGRMYWRSDTRQIYVIHYNGNSRIFQDEWYEGMPEDSCPGIEPPGGGERPTRGFGKVWCENPDVRAELGGGIHKEESFDDLLEDFENGVILRGSNRVNYIILYNGPWFKYPEDSTAQAPLPASMYQWSGQPDSAAHVIRFDLDLTAPGDQQIVIVPPGTKVNGQIEFQAWGLASGEIGQVILFYSWGGLPPTDYKCLFNGDLGVYPGTHKTLDFSVTVPNTPGLYHLWVGKNAQYNCRDAADMIKTFPPKEGTVGIINVHPEVPSVYKQLVTVENAAASSDNKVLYFEVRWKFLVYPLGPSDIRSWPPFAECQMRITAPEGIGMTYFQVRSASDLWDPPSITIGGLEGALSEINPVAESIFSLTNALYEDFEHFRERDVQVISIEGRMEKAGYFTEIVYIVQLESEIKRTQWSLTIDASAIHMESPNMPHERIVQHETITLR